MTIHLLKWQVVNKTTRKDKTLDLILTNYPATVYKIETLPPIADHDIVYLECITANQNQEKYLNTPKQIGKI